MSVAPTPRAILIVAAAAPVALVIGVLMPHRWTLGLFWVALALFAMLVDGLLGAARGVDVHASKPATAGIGEPFAMRVDVIFPPQSVVRDAQVALKTSAEIDPGLPVTGRVQMSGQHGTAEIWLHPVRRGRAIVHGLWLRWTGPLGLLAHQRDYPSAHVTTILPDIRPVRSEGVRLFQRDALHGLIAQLERGEGSDLEALNEFHPGMDRRAIDWKASARHSSLLAKEYRTERDNRIVFAIDCGRAMSEPLAGIPRVDRAVTSAMLAAWAALKLGDRVSLYAFDSRPRVRTGALTGAESFPVLQRHAAEIDYSSDETNHIFALSSLAQQLSRRSLVIVFTDFTDPTGADLMVRAMGWLLKRHVVLFVVMRDRDLDDYIAAPPAEMGDIARAVTASALIHEQRAVILRLKRLGLDVLETRHDRLNLDLVNAYIGLKRRGRL
jgi:uncharacterized protein (DUF58 family)